MIVAENMKIEDFLMVMAANVGIYPEFDKLKQPAVVEPAVVVEQQPSPAVGSPQVQSVGEVVAGVYPQAGAPPRPAQVDVQLGAMGVV